MATGEATEAAVCRGGTDNQDRRSSQDPILTDIDCVKSRRTFIKGLCGSALNWLDLIKAGGYGEQCTRHAQCSIDLLKSAIEWTHRRQTLVSLADGTYMSQRSECDLPSFLAEMLTAGEGTVQV